MDLKLPAYAIAAWVGLFSTVVGGFWCVSHVIGDEPIDATARIILGATLLRLATVALALATVQRWGRRLPVRAVVVALWATAAAQLVYPVAETLVKLALLAGVGEGSGAGISNMSAEGWFNLAAVWLVFGVPGALFAVLAVRSGRRLRLRRGVPVASVALGVAALGAIGLAIG